MDVAQIWHEYQLALTRFLHSRVANPDDVDDLLQDILLKTHTNLHTLKDGASLKSWLFQIAQRTVVDFYRKKGRVSQVLTENFQDNSINADKNMLSGSIDLEDKSDRIKQELAQYIEPFIRQLSDTDAQLLTAIDLQGQSQKSYAEEHDIRYSTLKSQVKKSRSRLKAVFDNCCQFDIDTQGRVYDYQKKPTQCCD